MSTRSILSAKKSNIEIIDISALAILSLTTETLGRKIFLEQDANIAIYGARYWMDNQAPWNSIMIGWEFAIGNLANILGQPELAIWLMGAVLNIVATLSVYACGARLKLARVYSITAAVATAFWFLPPVGGWAGDHLSFCVGIAPALFFIFNRFCWSFQLNLITGASIGYGLTLKLNSYAPIALTGIFMIAIYQACQLGTRRKSKIISLCKELSWILAAFIITSITLDSLITLDSNLYQTIAEFYGKVANSKVLENQAGASRLLLIPLNQDFFEALKSGQKGVLIFAPLAFLFWVCTIVSTINAIQACTNSAKNDTPTTNNILQQQAVALLFLIGSSLSCLTLGRGLSHRLFLLPAGIIFGIACIHRIGARTRKKIVIVIIAYLTICWAALGFVQANESLSARLDDSIYDVSALTDNNTKNKRLCINQPGTSNASIAISKIHQIAGQSQNIKSTTICWDKESFHEQFAGIGKVHSLGNLMGASFANQQPARGVDARLVEEWDSSMASYAGRVQWVDRNADIINKLKLPYLAESTTNNAANAYFPESWQKGRQDQLQMLVKALGAHKMASINGINIWETRWAPPKNPFNNE